MATELMVRDRCWRAWTWRWDDDEPGTIVGRIDRCGFRRRRGKSIALSVSVSRLFSASPATVSRAFSILTSSRWRARSTVSSLDKSFDRAEDGVPVRLAGILADLS